MVELKLISLLLPPTEKSMGHEPGKSHYAQQNAT